MAELVKLKLRKVTCNFYDVFHFVKWAVVYYLSSSYIRLYISIFLLILQAHVLHPSLHCDYSSKHLRSDKLLRNSCTTK